MYVHIKVPISEILHTIITKIIILNFKKEVGIAVKSKEASS